MKYAFLTLWFHLHFIHFVYSGKCVVWSIGIVWIIINSIVITVKNPKIVGGEDGPKSYPYQVSLQLEDQVYFGPFAIGGKKYVHNCGGAIVSENCVLTAAHCVKAYQPRELSVLAGTNKLHNGSGQRYSVQDSKAHPNFKEFISSDIAIVRILGKFQFGENVAPIKYSNRKIGSNVNCTLTGWGYTNPFRFGDPSNDLQRVFLPSLSNPQCRKEGMNVTNTEICTYSRFAQGACSVCTTFSFCVFFLLLFPISWKIMFLHLKLKGDSGGPLVLENGKEVVGIVSYGTAVCAIGRPDVYTRVSEFEHWITENCAIQRPWIPWLSWNRTKNLNSSIFDKHKLKIIKRRHMEYRIHPE